MQLPRPQEFLPQQGPQSHWEPSHTLLPSHGHCPGWLWPCVPSRPALATQRSTHCLQEPQPRASTKQLCLPGGEAEGFQQQQSAPGCWAGPGGVKETTTGLCCASASPPVMQTWAPRNTELGGSEPRRSWDLWTPTTHAGGGGTLPRTQGALFQGSREEQGQGSSLELARAASPWKKALAV